MSKTILLGFCLALVSALVLGGMIEMASAQNAPAGVTTQPTPDWEKIKNDALAEKAALEAQKAVLDTKKALEDAKAALDPAKKVMDDKIADAKARKEFADANKAAADAEKSAAEARKAQADAAVAAFKAQVGEVPASGYTGAVTLQQGAGNIEAGLLAAKAVKRAAQGICDMLPQQTANKTVLLYSSGEVPNFQALILFRAQIAFVKKGFVDAQTASNSANSTAPGPPEFEELAVPPAAAAGLALEALNKLLAFFRTDYTVGGVDVSLEDSLLVHALAGLIADSKKNLTVQLPAVYNPGALSDAGSKILNEVKNLSQLRSTAEDKVRFHEKLIAYFTEDAKKKANTAPEDAKSSLGKAKVHQDAVAVWKDAMGLYDRFVSKLTTADEKGMVPLGNIIRDEVVADVLKENLLLVVKLQKSGGGYYTEKNLWTFLGGMPFFNMGGVVASFVLLDGQSGAVQKSGVVPVHGGFVRASDLPEKLNEK